jgi:CopG family nickel-responsive transcriptional regulator
MHAHLDHDDCIESVILRGPTAVVKRFADAISAERGVRHGQLNLITASFDSQGRHSHWHMKPHT